mmetsp:Transcript_13233/g.19268  ORF Transcript_13233/g.19268 Transcript_13233/m.19268 type:complete len:503 (-) Transcript_13233:99-1607(-)
MMEQDEKEPFLSGPRRTQQPQEEMDEELASSSTNLSDVQRPSRRMLQNIQRSSRRRTNDDQSQQHTNEAKTDVSSVISSLRNSTRRKSVVQRRSSETRDEALLHKSGRDKTRGPKLFLVLFLAMIIFDITKELTDEERREMWAAKPYVFFLKSTLKDEDDEDADDAKKGDGKTYTSLKDYMQKEEDDNTDDYIQIQSLKDLNTNGTEYFGKIITVPDELKNIADLTAPMDYANHKPLFWHIPRAGGSTLKDLAARCLRLNQASEVGAVIDPTAMMGAGGVRVVADVDGSKYLNVDTTTIQGIQRAGDLHAAAHPDLHLIVTPFLYETSSHLLNPVNQGRMFALFRHPVDRAVSMYHYLHKLDSAAGIMEGLNTIEDYARSPLVENNWMTRFLSNQWDGQLTTENELIAKEVLKHKCLVGLIKKKAESLNRFEKFMGWNIRDNEQEECFERLIDWDWSNKNKHDLVKKGSDTWQALVDANIFDVRLYRFAEELFEVQGELFKY